MSKVDVKIKMAQGTTQSPPTANPGRGNTWIQGKESDENDHYTVLSSYWYFYRHSNDGGAELAGGEVDLPSGGTFTVAPQSSEVVVEVSPIETVVGATSTTFYSVTGPAAPSKVWTITDIEHTDPDPSTDPDTFDVYARDKPGDPIVMCDPIIRNKGD